MAFTRTAKVGTSEVSADRVRAVFLGAGSGTMAFILTVGNAVALHTIWLCAPLAIIALGDTLVLTIFLAFHYHVVQPGQF